MNNILETYYPKYFSNYKIEGSLNLGTDSVKQKNKKDKHHTPRDIISITKKYYANIPSLSLEEGQQFQS